MVETQLHQLRHAQERVAGGRDDPEVELLGGLVQAILAGVPDLQRLRLSSIDSVEADEALIDATGAALSAALHAPREELTPRRRGEIAVRIAAAKARIVEDGLAAATRVFELTGARASSSSVGLDLYWRNLRTHSLHDPLPYKRREVGVYTLLNEVPEPSWYT